MSGLGSTRIVRFSMVERKHFEITLLPAFSKNSMEPEPYQCGTLLECRAVKALIVGAPGSLGTIDDYSDGVAIKALTAQATHTLRA